MPLLLNCCCSVSRAPLCYVRSPQVPKTVSGVPTEVLLPVNCWGDKAAYAKSLSHLAHLFVNNFKRFEVGGRRLLPALWLRALLLCRRMPWGGPSFSRFQLSPSHHCRRTAAAT